jgi:hypothetical protein
MQNQPYVADFFNVNRWRQCALLLFLILLFGCWSLHLGQDIDWDLKNYHFYNAYAFLHGRMGWDIAPAQMQTYFNPFFDVFNYILITTLPPRVVAFISGAFSGLAAFILYQIAITLFTYVVSVRLRLFYAIVVVIIGMTGVAGASQIGTMSNDAKVMLILLIALYAIIHAVNKDKLLLFITSGLLLGLVNGLKLTAASVAIGIFIGLMCSRQHTRRYWLCLLLFIASGIVGFLLTNGYWMWFLYHHFSNPFFPLYNNLFHSPYAEYTGYADARFHQHDIKHFLLLPFYLATNNHFCSELDMRDPRLVVALVFGVGFLIYAKQKGLVIQREWRFLFVSFIVSYLLWLVLYTIYRYAQILEIFTVLIMIYAIDRFFETSKLKIISLLLLTMSIAAWTKHFSDNGSHISFQKQYFKITIPTLESNSLILMLGGDPMAYIIPSFSQDTRFLGLDNNFSSPNKNTIIEHQIAHLIHTHQGKLYSLQLQSNTDQEPAVLHFYHLSKMNNSCRTITTNVNDIFLLCQLLRTTGE